VVAVIAIVLFALVVAATFVTVVGDIPRPSRSSYCSQPRSARRLVRVDRWVAQGDRRHR
jgi:hypothetical protein